MSSKYILHQLRFLRRAFRFVDVIGNRTLFKDHYISRQGASFIREDVLDQAKLLVEIRGPSTGRHVRLLVIHLNVIVDEDRLQESYQLQGDLQGYWYQIVVQNKERQQIVAEIRALEITDSQIPILLGMIISP